MFWWNTQIAPVSLPHSAWSSGWAPPWCRCRGTGSSRRPSPARPAGKLWTLSETFAACAARWFSFKADEGIEMKEEGREFKLRISGSPWGESQVRPPYLTRLQTLHPQVWLQWNQNVRDGKRLTRKVGWGRWRRGGTLCRKRELSSYYFLPAAATHFEI